ncbi:MAG: LD-carboxypeptidase [Raineya sp.]|jgi:muramoyltetrapeptide carboxypeptidase|nr:LD-carboxypeptidase [Raineya sp.]
MLFPSPLSKGSKIGVIAPASVVEPYRIEQGIKLLQEWGFEVVLGEHVFAEYFQFAGTPEQRLSDLQRFINDDSIDAIICARGGYGVIQFIDDIDFTNLIKKPKWIIGYSDVTVLHCALQKIHIASLHAPMLKGIEEISQESRKFLREILLGEKVHYAIVPHHSNRVGKAHGKLIGGNIALLHNQIGTSTDFDTEGKILFLEDVVEPLYNIDRMMRHLDRAGKLKNLAGLMIGDISRIKPETPPFDKNTEQIIWDLVKKYDYPVCFGFPCGHEAQNYPLICGSDAKLEVWENSVFLKFGHL